MYPKENLYKKPCQVCKETVHVRQGYIAKEKGRWITYCTDHWPYRVKRERRELTADGFIITPKPNDVELSLIKAMPGAKWDKYEFRWKVSLKMGDRKRVLELAERLDLDVHPDLRNIERSVEADRAELDGLYDYQVDGVDFLASKDYALLGDDMGTGKTVQTIKALPEGASCIAIVPACVKYNWSDEIGKWRPDLKVTILKGRGSFQWPDHSEVVITNYDILPERFAPIKRENVKYKEFLDNLEKGDRDQAKRTHLVVDEAHYVKNGRTNRAARVRGLAKICRVVWGLTGTPLLNKPGDLFGMLKNLNMASDVFGSFTRFCELFKAFRNKWGGLVYGRPDPIVPELLRRVMLRRLRHKVLPQLPTKYYTELKVDAIPRDLKKELDIVFDAWGPIVTVDKKLPDFSEFSEIRKKLALSRIPTMLEYVENCEEQEVPLLVFSAHRDPILECAKREGWEAITGTTSAKRRQEIVRDFQRGLLKGVALTIAAGGVGLTLTRAWKVLFVDLDWVPSNNSQAEDRVCRIGQKASKVEIIRMVSDHPLDLHVLKLIDQKMKVIDAAVERELKIKKKTESGESEQEYQERLVLIEEAIRKTKEKEEEKEKFGNWERNIARARVARYKDVLHERGKKHNKRRKIDYDPSKKELVREAFNYMVSVCDGAHSPDQIGFNKPDSHIAKYIKLTGIEEEEANQAAYYLLLGYKGQLKDKFKRLFRASRKKKS